MATSGSAEGTSRKPKEGSERVSAWLPHHEERDSTKVGALPHRPFLFPGTWQGQNAIRDTKGAKITYSVTSHHYRYHLTAPDTSWPSQPKQIIALQTLSAQVDSTKTNTRASTMTSEPPAKKKCLGVDCDNDAGSLQCPTCLKLGVKDSYFCSQDCFKKNWV